MKIISYAPTSYESHPIYFRRISKTFEYLTVIKGEIYTASIDLKPTLKGWILKLLGLRKDYFSEKEIEGIKKYLELMAQTTIETAKKKKEEKPAPRKNPKPIKISEKDLK